MFTGRWQNNSNNNHQPREGKENKTDGSAKMGVEWGGRYRTKGWRNPFVVTVATSGCHSNSRYCTHFGYYSRFRYHSHLRHLSSRHC